MLKQVKPEDNGHGCSYELRQLQHRIDALESVLERGLSGLTASITQLAKVVGDFGQIQREIILKVVQWLILTFSIVILTMLGVKIAEGSIGKIVGL